MRQIQTLALGGKSRTTANIVLDNSELVVINDPKLKDYSPTTRLAFAKFKSNLNKSKMAATADKRGRDSSEEKGSDSMAAAAGQQLPPLMEQLSPTEISRPTSKFNERPPVKAGWL